MKKIKRKHSPVVAFVSLVASVLLFLTFFLSVISQKGSGSILGFGGSGSGEDYTMGEMVSGVFVNEDHYSDASASAKKSYIAFYSNEDHGGLAKVFAILSLLTAIVGAVGILYSLAALVVKNLDKYMVLYTAIAFLLATLYFVFALIVASKFTGTLNFIVGSATVTTSIGIAPILALVGGIFALFAGFVVPKVLR